MNKQVYRLDGDHLLGNRHPKAVFGILVAVILAALVVIFAVASFRTKRVANTGSQPGNTAPSPTLEGRYLFNGTVVLGRGVEQQAQTASGTDYSQPFAQFASFKPQQYDGWLADLECPVTANMISFRQQVDNLQFNCRPEWLPELTKYIKFMNLANNHTYDLGVAGFKETQRTLEAAGVQTVGNFDVTVSQDICEVMALPVRVMDLDKTITKATLPIAVCAWQYFFRQPEADELEVMQRYAKIMPVFAQMHAGAEYFPTAAQNQVDIAHKLIDLGSEFVIGNSPHWVQNSEVYKNKLIVYSTGNFIFDQLDEETNRGLSLDVTFKTAYDKNLAAWLKLGQQCQLRGDTCLDQAEKLGLKKIQLAYTYAPVASVGGYQVQTKRADANVQRSVEERLDWAKTLQLLNQPAR